MLGGFVYRLDMIARAFLRYLYEDRRFRPDVAGFRASSAAAVVPPPVSTNELARVVRSLRDRELIVVSGADADGLPHRAGLTGSGLICAGRHDGDVEAWMREPTGDQSAVSAQHVADFGGLARVARVVLLVLPTVHACTGESRRIKGTAQALLAEARHACPDRDRVGLLAQQLRRLLTSGSVATTLGVVLLDSLDEAIQEGSPGGSVVGGQSPA